MVGNHFLSSRTWFTSNLLLSVNSLHHGTLSYFRSVCCLSRLCHQPIFHSSRTTGLAIGLSGEILAQILVEFLLYVSE